MYLYQVIVRQNYETGTPSTIHVFADSEKEARRKAVPGHGSVLDVKRLCKKSDIITTDVREGYQNLWEWFGISRSPYMVLSRALMHHMPAKWQFKMAELLTEWDNTYTDKPNVVPYVTFKDVYGKFIDAPEVFANYRHPDVEQINKLKGGE